MIAPILHTIFCSAFIAASSWALCQNYSMEASVSLLRPFAIVTTVVALFPLVSLLQEVFVARYSGAKYEMDSPQWFFVWAFIFSSLSLAPALGLISAVASRPAWCLILGVVALTPLFGFLRSAP